MKAFWKILGLGVLAASLTPYKIEKNEETGETSYQALLWRITSAPGQGEDKRSIDINLNEGTLTAKLADITAKKEEAHLFSDELSVEYASPDPEDIVEAVTEGAAEAVEKAEEAVEAAKEAAEEITEDPAEAAEEPKAE